MPVLTRSMKTLTPQEYEIAEILCELKNSYNHPRHHKDDDSEYVPSDDEGDEPEYSPPKSHNYSRSHTFIVSKNDLEDDDDSEYVPSDDEGDEPEYSPPKSHNYSRSHTFIASKNDLEDDDDSEYVPGPEDVAEDVIRNGCSDFSNGFPLDQEFFRVCKRVAKGKYSPEFTRWALQIQPVRSVGDIR